MKKLMMVSLAGIATIGIAACGSSSSSATADSSGNSGSTTTAASTDSSGGTPFSASAFTTVVPDGWTDQTQNSQVVTAATNSGESQNLLLFTPSGSGHIDVSIPTSPVPDASIPAYLASAANHGATNVSDPTSFTLGSATGQYVTYDNDQSGTTFKSEDMVINEGSTTYEIIYIVPSDSFDSQMPALQSILSSWKWTA